MSFEEKFLIKVIKLHKYDEDYYSEVLATTQIPHYFFMDNCEHFNDDHLVQYCQLEEKTIQHFIDEDLWDEARVLVGKTKFNEGIKAPELTIRPKNHTLFYGDTVYHYQNKKK